MPMIKSVLAQHRLVSIQNKCKVFSFIMSAYVTSAALYRSVVTSGGSSSALQIWDIGGDDSGKI